MPHIFADMFSPITMSSQRISSRVIERLRSIARENGDGFPVSAKNDPRSANRGGRDNALYRDHNGFFTISLSLRYPPVPIVINMGGRI